MSAPPKRRPIDSDVYAAEVTMWQERAESAEAQRDAFADVLRLMVDGLAPPAPPRIQAIAGAALAALGEREPKGREAGVPLTAPPPGAEPGDAAPRPLSDGGSPTRSAGSEGGSRSPNGGGD